MFVFTIGIGSLSKKQAWKDEQILILRSLIGKMNSPFGGLKGTLLILIHQGLENALLAAIT